MLIAPVPVHCFSITFKGFIPCYEHGGDLGHVTSMHHAN